MTLLGDRVWLPGDVKSVAGAARDALFSIESRVRAKQVPVDVDAIGWGQFLDDLHHSDSQWGLLGTSAGYQVLARAQMGGLAAPELAKVRPLLPEDVSNLTALHPAVQEKAGPPKYDLQNIIRLAFVAEALVADKAGTIVHANARPPLVDYILSLANNGESWNPRSAQPEQSTLQGHAVTTALVLHALRRFEDDPSQFRPIRVWLARQLLHDASLRARPDYVALTGLALSAPTWDNDNPEDVRDAITSCRQNLLAWRRQERTLVVNRPLFEGYQLGTTTDYLILNPELMAALFLLREDNPRPGRRFVSATTREVAQNAQVNHGFEGQLGALPTVDQEWASRLLHLYEETYNDKSRRHLLLPGRLTSPVVRWALLVGVVLLLAGIMLGAGVDFKTGVLVFVAGAVVTLATLLVGGADGDD